MPNTIPSELINDFFVTMEKIAQERVGFIGSCGRDASLDRVAANSTIRSIVAPPSTASDITPGLYAPDEGDQTFTSRSFTISKQRSVPFRWNGTQTYTMNQAGPGLLNAKQQQIAQAIRTLRNEQEVDLGVAGALAASRAFGTATTNPFATTLGDLVDVRQILFDNACPMSDPQLVINSSAESALLKLTQLTNVNQSGDSEALRFGRLTELFGVKISASSNVARPTSGTMTGGKTHDAGYAIGATVLAFQNATGTGVMTAGDVFTIAGDTNKYIVASATFAGANPATGDSITIAAPGLLKAVPAANTAITVVAISARNLIFERNALVLGTRLPDLPEEGDAATRRETLVDPFTGIAYEFALYQQYRQNQWRVGCAWGVGSFKPNFMAVLLGA